MARPEAKPALGKAPVREHPVAPQDAPAVAPAMIGTPAPPSPRTTAMYSARVDLDLKRRVKRYAVENDISVQDITEQALTEFLAANADK